MPQRFKSRTICLEGGASANSFAFMERSAINTLDPARNWGLGFNRYDYASDSTLAIGLFRSGSGPFDIKNSDGSDTAFTARWTKLAWNENNGERLMHFGVAISERVPNNDWHPVASSNIWCELVFGRPDQTDV
jgi:phosphate-selective porin OprO/OprP